MSKETLYLQEQLAQTEQEVEQLKAQLKMLSNQNDLFNRQSAEAGLKTLELQEEKE